MSKLPYEERKKLKQEKLKAKQQERKKQQIQKAVLWALVVVGIPAILYWLVTVFAPSQEELSGEFYQTQGGEHIAPPYENPPYEWNTNPPTGGWHTGVTLGAGFYETKQDFPPIIHSLEHGAVVIYYKTSIPEEDKERLRKFWDNNSRLKLIVVPYDSMDYNYALTAWERLDAFDKYERARIEKFVSDHHNKGPERAPIGGISAR